MIRAIAFSVKGVSGANCRRKRSEETVSGIGTMVKSQRDGFDGCHPFSMQLAEMKMK